MRALTACLFAASLAAAEIPAADFEGEEPLKGWSGDGEVSAVRAPAHAGSGALRWKAPNAGARLAFAGVKGDLTKTRAIRFFAWTEGDVEREIVVKVRAEGGDFWRKVVLRPQTWSDIAVPLWQFREDAAPRWDKAEGLEFSARRPGTLVLDDLSFPEGDGLVEPPAALAARVFGDANPAIALTEHFRVFTDAPVDPGAVAARLEAGLVRFRMVLGTEEPLDRPVTLVIRKSVDDYHASAVDTSREVYGADLPVPKSGGITFYAFSFTSYEEKYGALRPVFLHECGHQLVSRLLGFHGANGATWLEEGLCYFLQNEFTPIENAKEEALKLLANPKRPALATFDGRERIDSGAENLTAFLVIHFILKGPHAAQRKEFFEALRENDVHLLKSAAEGFGLKAEPFEKEWEEFTKKWAEEK